MVHFGRWQDDAGTLLRVVQVKLCFVCSVEHWSRMNRTTESAKKVAKDLEVDPNLQFRCRFILLFLFGILGHEHPLRPLSLV